MIGTSKPPDPVRRPPLRGNLFARIGYTCNPFRVLWGDEVLGVLIDPSLPATTRELLSGGTDVIEFVGESGSGKSTHVLAAAHVAENELGEVCARTYVPVGDTCVSWPVGSVDRWCIDEAQRVRRSLLARIVRAARRGDFSLVLGTHTSVAELCERIGASCRTIRLAAADRDRMGAFIAARMAAVRTDGDRIPRVDSDALAVIERSSGGNLHVVEGLMYEVFQAYATRGAVPPTVTGADVEAAIEAYRSVRITVRGVNGSARP